MWGPWVAPPWFRQHVGVLGAKADWRGAGRTPGREHKPAAVKGSRAEAKEERGAQRETLNMK